MFSIAFFELSDKVYILFSVTSISGKSNCSIVKFKAIYATTNIATIKNVFVPFTNHFLFKAKEIFSLNFTLFFVLQEENDHENIR